MKFGTDGVRGHAGDELTPGFALELGRAAGPLLVDPDHNLAVVGGDTRESTPAFAAALTAGFLSVGIDVVDLGVATTPEVAYAAQTLGAIGAVVSASHNAFHDNGIKLFAPGGRKLTDDVQATIEAVLAEPEAQQASGSPAFGRLLAQPPQTEHGQSYSDHVLKVLEGRLLQVRPSVGGSRPRPMRIVVDMANGAGCAMAQVFERAGADVVALADAPDGRNINAGCGATHPALVAAAVAEHSADVGIALDGDADRLIAVDENGAIVDGDHVIAICADDLRARGRLANDTVVVTVMTNLGFRQAMAARGISVVETAVGDRYVLEALADGGFSLGGEQSGHVVFTDYATTGDGVLTALTLLDIVARSGTRLSELAASAMTSLPQVLVNVRVSGDARVLMEAVAADIEGVERDLGDTGRVLVRPSGTEPLVRVMVEAPTSDEAQSAADSIAAALSSASVSG